MRQSDGAPEPEYRLENQIGFILRKAHQRASEIFAEVMAGHDVTPMQFSALIKLDDLGQCSQNRLGRLVAMDPATTLGVISRLRKRGLIAQASDPADKRRLLLSLTAKGAELARRLRAQGAEVSARVLAPLPPAARERLFDDLGRLGPAEER